MTRFRDLRAMADPPSVLCPSCGSDRLGAVVEPLVAGGEVFCGRCGVMLIAEYRDSMPNIRRATPHECATCSPEAAAFRSAWILDKIDTKDKGLRPPPGPLLEELEQARRPD